MSTQEDVALRTYQDEVAALATGLARMFRQGALGIDELHRTLAERCRTHPLLQDTDGCDQVLASSAFADAALRLANPQTDYSLPALATYALQSDVTLYLTQLCRVPLRPTSRC
jgi:hypothetical protein